MLYLCDKQSKTYRLMNATLSDINKIKWYYLKNITKNLLVIARNLAVICIEILLIVEGLRLLLE